MKIIYYPLSILLLLALVNCKNRVAAPDTAGSMVKTPVTVTTVNTSAIAETIVLNATSAFLKKNEVRANTGGYVRDLNVNPGQMVKLGSLLFTIKTKEAQALSRLSEKDSMLGIRGQIRVLAPVSGIISNIANQLDSYVNDGDVVVTLADLKSFVFILHVPFEQKAYAEPGKKCTIHLPDGSTINGKITSRLSEVDLSSQTQSYIVTPLSNPSLPENLVVTVELEKSFNESAQVVDKSCVLSDETMENFWVMKLLNDTTAVKIPVKRGMSSGERIEILSPQFMPDERLISSGSYGLPDTALVSIIK